VHGHAAFHCTTALWAEDAMTAWEGIVPSIPVFAAHARGVLTDVRAELVQAGVPPALAAEVVEFLPLALARALLDGMGVRFADHCARRTARYSGLKPATAMNSNSPRLLTSPAVAKPSRKTGSSDRSFLPITRPSAVCRTLNSGCPAEGIEVGPPVLLANDRDQRPFDDTSGGPQPRARRRWRLWA
jgi:hypothetical protein